MKTRITALAGMLVLSLLTTMALADVAELPDDSDNATPILGQLKDKNACEGTAFFKNQFPSLTNGPSPGVKTVPFTIDGETVLMAVSWTGDNSFGFSLDGGVAHKVGVTVDTNNFVYDYSSAPVSSDGNLNWYMADNIVGDDVNHLDLCLAVADPGDIEPPFVSIDQPDGSVTVTGPVTVLATVRDESDVLVTIRVDDGVTVEQPMDCALQSENPNVYRCSFEWDTTGLSGSYTIAVVATDTPGNTTTETVTVSADSVAPVVTISSPADETPPAQVSGDVSVVATVTDDNLDASSVTASVYPDGDAPSAVELMLASTVGDVYTWTWETGPLPGGLYTIEVSASDTLGNTTEPPASVTVEVIKLFTDCFGTLGDEDFDPEDPSEPDYAGGCKPTNLARVQTAPDTDACAGDNPPNICFLEGTLLKPPHDATSHCGVYGFRDPRMDLVGGEWVPVEKRALKVFDEIGIHPDLVARVEAALPPNNILADAVVLDENTYCANGCCAIAQHAKGYTNGAMQGDELQVLYPVWPQNPATGLVFIKTHFPEDVLPTNVIAQCYGTDGNFDLQDAAGAGYSPLDQQLDDYGFLSVLTQKCINPARTLTRNNGIDVSNVVETAGIDFDADPVGVLNFKYGLSEDQFGLTFAALDCAAPLLLTGKFSDVSSPVNQAKRRFDNFNSRSLQKSIEALEDAAFALRTKTTWMVTEKNCPGEALGRIEHLIWDLGLLKRELERLEGLGIL